MCCKYNRYSNIAPCEKGFVDQYCFTFLREEVHHEIVNHIQATKAVNNVYYSTE